MFLTHTFRMSYESDGVLISGSIPTVKDISLVVFSFMVVQVGLVQKCMLTHVTWYFCQPRTLLIIVGLL